MSAAHDHSHHVNLWMEAASSLPFEQLVQSFEQAMAALWSRAYLTLGDVTLTAILDRILSNAADHFPELTAITIGATGMDCRKLARKTLLDVGELREGMRFLLLEFLVVIGNLTGELLTPALHSELSKTTPANKRARAEGQT